MPVSPASPRTSSGVSASELGTRRRPRRARASGGRPRPSTRCLRPVRGLARSADGAGRLQRPCGSGRGRRATCGSWSRRSSTPTARPSPGSPTRRPLVLDVRDRFVLREAGRRQTVGGGIVLDRAAARARGRWRPVALVWRAARRAGARPRPRCWWPNAARPHVARSCALTGSRAAGGDVAAAWTIADPSIRERVAGEVADGSGRSTATIRSRRARRSADARKALARALVAGARRRGGPRRCPPRRSRAPRRRGAHARPGPLGPHRVDLGRARRRGRATARRGLRRARGDPPDREGVARAGVRPRPDRCGRAGGVLVRLSPGTGRIALVRGRVPLATVRAAASAGITLSALREALGTSRKYAVPLAEYLDRVGLTRREGRPTVPSS